MKKGIIVLMICALLVVVGSGPILPISDNNYSTCGPVFPIGD